VPNEPIPPKASISNKKKKKVTRPYLLHSRHSHHQFNATSTIERQHTIALLLALRNNSLLAPTKKKEEMTHKGQPRSQELQKEEQKVATTKRKQKQKQTENDIQKSNKKPPLPLTTVRG
jgi:hypothetical protein